MPGTLRCHLAVIQTPHHSSAMKKVVFFLLLAATLPAQTPITFPKDGGVLHVKAFDAKANDDGDDTAAIQKALNAFPTGNRIVYLPAGTFIATECISADC